MNIWGEAARICDGIAKKYSRGTFNDCSREVRAAEECAATLRAQPTSPVAATPKEGRDYDVGFKNFWDREDGGDRELAERAWRSGAEFAATAPNGIWDEAIRIAKASYSKNSSIMADARIRELSDQVCNLDALVVALIDAWRGDIRAHQDQCPATFSNCAPDDCACGLTELREAKIVGLQVEFARIKPPVAATKEGEAQPNGKMNFEQRARAMWLAESRGIDDETAHELVYLRDRKIELESQLAATAPNSSVDSERMDWLEDAVSGGHVESAFEMDGGVHLTVCIVGDEPLEIREKNTLREAIDAARDSGGKQ